MTRDEATTLARATVEALRDGEYAGPTGERVDWSAAVRHALEAKASLRPGAALPEPPACAARRTKTTVTAERTLQAARRLHEAGGRVAALNFANGMRPGGGFLHGALAQEEALCRCSALYATLEGDPMYAHHQARGDPAASDWVILSPDVPVFRTDDGTPLARPWPLTFLTCAAPYAPEVGQPRAGDLLQRRILRVLDVARAFGHQTLVLGAWGCGAFGHDPRRTAADFRAALEGPFAGAFGEVVFAVSDSTFDQRTIRPFRDVFASGSADAPA